MTNKKNDKTINLEEIDFEIHLCIPKAYRGESGYYDDYIMYNEILEHSPKPVSLIKDIRKLITNWIKAIEDVEVVDDCHYIK